MTNQAPRIPKTNKPNTYIVAFKKTGHRTFRAAVLGRGKEEAVTFVKQRMAMQDSEIVVYELDGFTGKLTSVNL